MEQSTNGTFLRSQAEFKKVLVIYGDNVWGLHSTEEAFLLPTQQPQPGIPAPERFFSLYCLVRGQY